MVPRDPSGAAHGFSASISQLLAETLIRAHPHLAKESAETQRRITDDWLENLEKHSTGVIGALVEQMITDGNVDGEVATLLRHAQDPSAQFGSLLQQFFIYGLMFQLAGTMLAPFTQQVQNDVWTAHPDRPLPPPDVATAVVRGISLGDSAGVDVPGWAAQQAAKSGMPADVFATMVGVSGIAPSLQLLFDMVRRGIITESQLTEGIKEGDIKDKWIPFVEKLRYVQPSPTDMVAAAVREQLPYDEARDLATKIGLEPADYLDGNPDWFKVLFDISGRPPGPVELGHMTLRGIIPRDGSGPDVLSFQQGIAESDVKTKWTEALWRLMQYVPPNEEVGTLLLHGGISKDQAVAYWQENGVPAALAEAYAYVREHEKITQDRVLTKGEILNLVTERTITDDQALGYLETLGYSGQTASELLGLAHFRYEAQVLRTLVRRVSSLYTGHKINRTQAAEALHSIGLPEAQTTQILDTLTVQRDTQVLIPSAGQIETAFNYGIVDYETASTMLRQLGYDEWSAWFVLSARLHGPIPNVPEPPRPSTLP